MIRSSGIDLPIYPEDEVAWTTGDIIDVARSGVDEFPRRAWLEYDGQEENLMAVLALADFVNTRTSEYLGIEQAQYSWGLAPLGEATSRRLGENYQNNHELLPKGFGLVALTKNVAGAKPITQNRYWSERLHNWTSGVLSFQPTDGGPAVGNKDLRVEQFVMRPAQDPEIPDWAQIPVYVDFEPRLRVSSR